MSEEIKEILNNADSNTKFKMVDEDGTKKEMNIAGLIEQLLNDNKHLLDYITNLEERIDKAIDILATLLLYDTSKRSDAGLILINANRLIDILKGDDNNESN